MAFHGLSVTILMPVFNDWSAVDLLLKELDRVCADSDLRPRVVLINDGSTEQDTSFLSWPPQSLAQVEVLDLRCNVGHQRALCVGVVHVHQEYPGTTLLVMDADGEDSPRDVPRLIKEFITEKGQKAIFAERGRRMETITFKLLYQFYRAIHFLLVGFDIRIGNFSVLPQALLDPLLHSPDLWNHYAATVMKLKLPMATVRIDRAKRLKGRSQMGFARLIVHGLSAMSVYGEIIGARILVFASALLCFGFLALVAVIATRLMTTLAIPGWATTATGLLLVLILQVGTVALLFTLGVLGFRGVQVFIPIRDCPAFISAVRRLV
jgi:polyisoprenyl-phosphate glycosyltransferase